MRYVSLNKSSNLLVLGFLLKKPEKLGVSEPAGQ